MTPAINSARHAGIAFQLHEYQHDATAPSYGLEAADKLGVTAEQVFKTLVVSLDGKQLAVGIVPVNSQLGLKQIAKAAGAKKGRDGRAGYRRTYHRLRARRSEPARPEKAPADIH